MKPNQIVTSATTSPVSNANSNGPQSPGLLTGALSISPFSEAVPDFELTLTVEAMGPGILRAAIVDIVSGENMLPVCMTNLQGPIGGPQGLGDVQAPETQTTQSWTQADVAGVRFGIAGATLGVYIYQADSPARITATLIA